MAIESIETTCNRDCPDACGMIAGVENGRVVSLRGNPAHPVTNGFLCFRTNRFLERQYDPSRITKPLLRQGDRQVEIPLGEALDLAAERLMQIKKESGPAAILHYQSGGSLGLMKLTCKYFFEQFGPTATKVGDICSGGGDAAQMLDFGAEDSNDVFDLYNSKHIINWGKNLHVSNVHLIPIIKEAKRRGTKVITVDPVYTRSAQLSDHYVLVRPDGDLALGLAVARQLFESGRVSPLAGERCDHLDAFRALAFSRPLEAWVAECDVGLAQVLHLADALADGPTAILVGWGLQRRLRGAANVRILDALCAISGNLGIKGGGVSFYYKRRGAFDTSFNGRLPPPRVFNEPLLGREILAANPPVRAIWVTAGNPVAMLPDSATVARAFESTEFTVVVDSFPTDTTRRATLVLPTTTMLEDDDLLGAYGHHYLGVSRPVVPPPEGVLTDHQIMQELAARVGLGDLFSGTAREWKQRMLRPGLVLEELEKGPVKNPYSPPVLFEDGKVPTETGRVNLIHEIPPRPPEEPGYPLALLSNSTEKAQSSQWAVACEGPVWATVHPEAAPEFEDGDVAELRSAIGHLQVRLRFDPHQRRDVVIVPKGGHYDRGWAVNSLIRARATDLGNGAAYLDTHVRLERPQAFLEFAKIQIRALKHDAEQIEAWRHGKGAEIDLRAIGARILRLHETIREQGWLHTTEMIERGLTLIREGLADGRPVEHIALVLDRLINRTRRLLGDDPGPEPHGGPLAAQMAIGIKKR